MSQFATFHWETWYVSIFAMWKALFSEKRRFFFNVHDFHHFSSLTSSLIFTSSLSLSCSPSPSVVSYLLLSVSPVFCCDRFLLCFVLLLPLVAAGAGAGGGGVWCCVVAAFRCSFSFFPLVFSVTQAIAEQLSGAFFCAARRVQISWPSR